MTSEPRSLQKFNTKTVKNQQNYKKEIGAKDTS